MSQNSMNIPAGSGAAVRAAINAAIQALASNNAGKSAPTTTYAGMWWADTTAGRIRRRSSDNLSWIDCGALDSTLSAQFASLEGSSSQTFNVANATKSQHAVSLGQLQAQLSSVTLVSKADKITPCLVKTGSGAISVKAGTAVLLSSGNISFTAQTPVTMPTLTAGTDYSVWVKPDGSAVAVADPYSSPASDPVPGALKIGGFHYGLVAPGTTLAGGSFNTTTSSPLVSMVWKQADVDAIAGINQWSIWDLSFRPLCDPRGMACVTNANGKGLFWFDIYFCGTQHITNGTSAYNTDVASGTVQPVIPVMFGGNGTTKYTTLTWYEANEIAFSHKKRLMSYQEFASAAFGVTENQSLGGATSTIPATARQAGYTSRWGGEQMTGHHWTWGNVAHGVSGSAWVSGPDRGKSFGTPYGAIFGGSRGDAASSGSRCSCWSMAPWSFTLVIGLRAACDHFNGAL